MIEKFLIFNVIRDFFIPKNRKRYCDLDGPTSSAEAETAISPSVFGTRQSFERIASAGSLYSRLRKSQYTSAVTIMPVTPPANPRRKTETSVEVNVSGPTATSIMYAPAPPARAARILSKNVRRTAEKNPPN